jgi:hypothetical protein
MPEELPLILSLPKDAAVAMQAMFVTVHPADWSIHAARRRGRRIVEVVDQDHLDLPVIVLRPQIR